MLDAKRFLRFVNLYLDHAAGVVRLFGFQMKDESVYQTVRDGVLQVIYVYSGPLGLYNVKDSAHGD